MKKQLTPAIAATFLLSSAAFAQDPYIGFGVGSATYTEGDFDESDTGFSLYGGSRLTKNFGLELSFTDFGNLEGDYNGINASAEVSGVGAAAVGYLPLNDKFDLFGKAGMMAWDADLEYGALNGNDDGTDLLYGVGAIYHANEQFSVRADWQAVDLDDGDLDMFSLNAEFHF